MKEGGFMDKEKFDLKQLRDHFCDIGEKRWGQTLQLEELEGKFRLIKEGKEELSLMHIEAIRDDFAFTRWWKMPEMAEEDLEALTGIFVNLSPRSGEVIWKLFDLIKNIEIVSCILRFIDPQNYGILSPPVENILNVRGKHQVEKYINYLIDLEKLKEEYDFKRIADVDMALWVLSNILNYPGLRTYPKYRIIYEDYRKRANPIKIIMAKNSLNQIWEEKGYLFIAELLLNTDHDIAGIVAGREIERFVHNQCDKHRIKKKRRTKKGKLRPLPPSALSKKLWEGGNITYKEHIDIKKWWNLRITLTHKFEMLITRDEVDKMIEGIINLTEKYKAKIFD